LDPDHPLLDALREAGAQILAEEKHRWTRELALVEAQTAKSLAEARAELAELKSTLERAVAERLSTLRDGAPGPKGEPGRDGCMRTVTDWSDGVHYEGDLVVRDGALWQCIKDTAHAPPHSDWTCVARAGRDGGTPKIRGTWVPDGRYQALDTVALNGCSFIATTDNPGPCPGEGWQLVARQGQRGIAGPRGERGDRGLQGDRGERGPPAPHLTGWKIDREIYTITPIMSDGSACPPIELRDLFLQFQDDTT
jgi:hypothetical protein